MSRRSGPFAALATARSAWPRARGALLLTAFLSAATVPALLSWTSHDQGRVLGDRERELEELLRAGVEGRRESLPSLVASGEPAAALLRVPTGAGLRFKNELLFSPAQVDLFHQKSAREGEFERVLAPPDALTAKVTRDGIEVDWTAPADLAAVQAALRDQPLLRLGFRVYRWREGEEPQLLATLEGLRTAYQDRDLPLWRERFTYCVATVIEGTIGDLPTLIESKLCPVPALAETLENVNVEVLDGTAERARFEVSAWLNGQWRRQTVEASSGERLRPSFRPSPADEAPALAVDTGFTVRELRWVEGEQEAQVQRPEFLPDGRRRLDAKTGAPVFRTETVKVLTRTLLAVLADPSGAERTLSAPVAQ